MPGEEAERFTEAVLALVERIPPGSVTSYGAIAHAIGGSGPRRVGQVLSLHGGGVSWWRVVRADGSLPPSHGERARAAYAREGTPLTADGRRADLRRGWWEPADDPGEPTSLPIDVGATVEPTDVVSDDPTDE